MHTWNIDAQDWIILDALADDFESAEQIQSLIRPLELSQEQVIDRLQRLHSDNFIFLILNQIFDRQSLLDEIDKTKDRKFWFGRTENGYKAWQDCSDLYFKDNTAEQDAAANP
jgi:hypothetical protein